MSEFIMPTTITTATRQYADNNIRRDVNARIALEKFVDSLTANYPEDTSYPVKSALSGAVKTLVSERVLTVNGVKAQATPADAAKASKMVTLVWLQVALTRSGVKVETLPKVTVKGSQVDALRLVVNGEGGKDLADFRKAIMDAAKDGKWEDVRDIITTGPAKPEATTPENDPEASNPENGTDESVNVASDVSARNLHRAFGFLAKSIRESAVEYTASDVENLQAALAEVSMAVESRQVAETRAA